MFAIERTCESAKSEKLANSLAPIARDEGRTKLFADWPTRSECTSEHSLVRWPPSSSCGHFLRVSASASLCLSLRARNYKPANWRKAKNNVEKVRRVRILLAAECVRPPNAHRPMPKLRLPTICQRACPRPRVDLAKSVL